MGIVFSALRMKFKMMLASLLAIFAVAFMATPAVTAAPVAQAKTTSMFYHGPVGNAQGIQIKCARNGATYWILQGQNSNQCPYYEVSQAYVPANYYLCYRPYNSPGSGCVAAYGGGQWWNIPAQSGGTYGWSVHY
jgi:hypothetical protein